MYGLGLRTTLSALLRLCTRRRPTMRPANSLAAHRRLVALHTATLALGLTARRYSAETGGEGLVHLGLVPSCQHRRMVPHTEMLCHLPQMDYRNSMVQCNK